MEMQIGTNSRYAASTGQISDKTVSLGPKMWEPSYQDLLMQAADIAAVTRI